ncbi:hypothetical protein PV08_03345 [Exophiala spinifera]|uniref:Uncharacterized protein n=1 Tax=Exophiala spinifera TaxID=91928 RepID=A0A0D2BKH4_9EURO|nr:uncharacterized protein PV08_03345 [Exophiala spinifera]KIW19055.1 hypothetical protein PV08_03345 [Exophiala spinifera]
MVLTDSEDDDLDAPRVKRQATCLPKATVKAERSPLDVRHLTSGRHAGRSDAATLNDEVPTPKQHGAVATALERVQLDSDDELKYMQSEDERFKNREKKAKKRALKSSHRARQAEKARHRQPGSNKAGVNTGVGIRGLQKKRKRVQNYDDSDSDADLMEWTMPDYVKDRRSKFDRRTKELKQGGLWLPPTYDDVYFSDDENLQQLRERPEFPASTASREYKDIQLPYSLGLIPAPIAQFLRDYQVKGVAFLHELFVYQKGGILGDDMGLGKTVQVISFLTAAYGKTGDERDKKRMRKMRRANQKYPRTLIICPGTLMENWKDEFRRWGWWHVDTYHGGASRRQEVFSQAHAGMLEVMITTYHTYRTHKEEINLVEWDCVVADECHQIKERKSEITKAMADVNALCRIGLTGTAIQNKYEELWVLLNWTNPGKLGPITTWKETICIPLKLGQSHNASNYELARARRTAKMLVTNLLPQFFLRRTKALIKAQLPKKTDRVVFCPLTPTQAKAYQNFLDSDIVSYIRDSGQPCECGSGKKAGWCCNMVLEDGSPWQHWVFPAIANLQKISNHLASLIPQGSDSSEKQAKDLDMLEIAMPDQWRELYKTRDSILHTGNPEYCGKWRVLKKLLTFWHDQGDNKVLIFSHSVRLLRMLLNLFISTQFNVKYLDGSMAYEDRYQTVKEFNTDPTQFVFLISTKAGGVGLNITSANKVVIVDPNWNPSFDLQAQDRAYRIGQTRDVEVFRLVSQGTMEEIVYARQIYKQQQANIGYNATSERRYFQGVQDRKDQKGEIFGLQNLFAYQNENQVLRDIVNKTNVAESKAGVRVASLEFEEHDSDSSDGEGRDEDRLIKTEEKEDAAMSQLAAEIIGDDKPRRGKANKPSSFRAEDTPRRTDPVQAILSSVGVSYTHENSEVIGTSKVEEYLSKRAEKAVGDADWAPREQLTKVFEDESQSQPQRNLVGPSDDNGYTEDRIVTPDGEVRYRFRPPTPVKRRQFCSMARWAGYDDVVWFALAVESWTQAKRRECLDRFYHARRDVLAGLVKQEEFYHGDVKQEEVDLKREKEEERDGDEDEGKEKAKLEEKLIVDEVKRDEAKWIDIEAETETESESEDDEL